MIALLLLLLLLLSPAGSLQRVEGEEEEREGERQRKEGEEINLVRCSESLQYIAGANVRIPT